MTGLRLPQLQWHSWESAVLFLPDWECAGADWLRPFLSVETQERIWFPHNTCWYQNLDADALRYDHR